MLLVFIEPLQLPGTFSFSLEVNNFIQGYLREKVCLQIFVCLLKVFSA